MSLRKKDSQPPDYGAPDEPKSSGTRVSTILFAIAVIVGILLIVSFAATTIDQYTYGGAVITRDWSKYCTESYPGSAYSPSTGTCEYPSPASPTGSDEAASSSGDIPSKATTSFSGHGDEVVPFSVNGTGSRVFSLYHSGTDSFIVWLYDDKGNTVDLLVNEGGRYSGKKAENLTGGKYYLDITADGAWTVRISAA